MATKLFTRKDGSLCGNNTIGNSFETFIGNQKVMTQSETFYLHKIDKLSSNQLRLADLARATFIVRHVNFNLQELIYSYMNIISIPRKIYM